MKTKTYVNVVMVKVTIGSSLEYCNGILVVGDISSGLFRNLSKVLTHLAWGNFDYLETMRSIQAEALRPNYIRWRSDCEGITRTTVVKVVPVKDYCSDVNVRARAVSFAINREIARSLRSSLIAA